MRVAIVILAACVAVFFGCSDKPTYSSPGETIYFTSFERAADTAGWEGIVPELFVVDPAPGCGHRSLRISGGCIMPTASLILGSFEKPGYYGFSVWGKAVDEIRTGQLMLIVEGNERPVVVTVGGLNWHILSSDELVFCPARKPLRMELFVGGIVGGSMTIDGLRIYRADAE